MAFDIDKHLSEITKLRKEADGLPDDDSNLVINKVELLSKCLAFIGRVSSVLDGDYKRVYAERKYEHAKAFSKAVKDKAATAEVFIKDLRLKEADAYEMMQRWRNAFDSTKEEIHALKLKSRIDTGG